MSKYTKEKSKCPKNYALTEVEVAELAGCSVSYVKQIRAGVVELNSELAQRVLAIDELADESKSILKNHIKQIVKL